MIFGLFEQIVPQDKRTSIKEFLCLTNEENCRETDLNRKLVRAICFWVNKILRKNTKANLILLYSYLLWKSKLRTWLLSSYPRSSAWYKIRRVFDFFAFSTSVDSKVVTSQKQTRINIFFHKQ